MIEAHLNNSTSPLAIVGEPGIGKSVLLAQWVRHHQETHPDSVVLFHSAEASSTGANTDYVGIRVLQELEKRLGVSSQTDYNRYIDAQVEHLVSEWCANSSGERPILVFDAADRFKVGFWGRMPLDFLTCSAQPAV